MSESSDYANTLDVKRLGQNAFGLMRSLPIAMDSTGDCAGLIIKAGFKNTPADFVVDERLAFEAEKDSECDTDPVSTAGITTDNDAEHLLLRIRKSRINTLDLQRMLAQWIGCRRSDVGYCGLKDSQAVTSQWFSVPYRQTHQAVARIHAGNVSLSQVAQVCQSELEKALPRLYTHAPPEKVGDEISSKALNKALKNTAGVHDSLASIEVIDAVRYLRKLRPGSHVANRFAIVLRDFKLSVVDLDKGDVKGDAALHRLFEERLNAVKRYGFPNYFGLQRFGYNGSNLTSFLEIVSRAKNDAGRGGRRGKLSPRQQIAVSAARSFLFNTYCAARVEHGSWLSAATDEPVMLGTGNGFFVNDGADESVQTRILTGDLSPSGPLIGVVKRRDRVTAVWVEQECESLTAGLMNTFDAQDVRTISRQSQHFFDRIGLQHQRRALRAMPKNLVWHWMDQSTLQIEFELPPGTYATALLQQLGLRV